MSDFIWCVLTPIVMVLIVVIPIHCIEKVSCYSKTDSFESRHGFLYGCQIKHNDKWINYENYRGFEDG